MNLRKRDNEHNSHISTLKHSEMTEENTDYNPPGPCRLPVSNYVMWNSTMLPHVISYNGNSGDKRKKVNVTMEEKLRALQRLDAGEPVKNIAQELGVGKSTVSDWKKHRIEIERWYASQAGGSCIKERKTMKKGKHARVEKALYHWFDYNRSRGLQVSGQMLQQKALQFKYKIDGEEGEMFSASEGWLGKWKKRFSIASLVNTNLNIDENVVEEFKKGLFEGANLTEEQIYCCGRTLLNYRMLPTNIFGSKSKACSESSTNEETVLLLACCNASGNQKLRLTFIGKSEKFQTLETIKDNELLPFGYSYQKEIWLDDNIFRTWFTNEFVPAVEKNLISNQLPRKAVLLVNNYPSFGYLDEFGDGDIRVVFIPLQAASKCHPMERGVYESFKKKYWCRLLNSIISTSTDVENCLTTLRNVDIIEAIQFASEAWEDIPGETLVQSWDHLANQNEYKDWAACESLVNDMASDDKELVTLLRKIVSSDDVDVQDVHEWLVNEDEDEIITEDIVAMILKEPQMHLDIPEESFSNYQEAIEIKTELLDEDCSAENIPPEVKHIRHSEGFKALSKALEYISQQEESTPSDIAWFLKWRDYAARKSLSEEKQKKSGKRLKIL